MSTKFNLCEWRLESKWRRCEHAFSIVVSFPLELGLIEHVSFAKLEENVYIEYCGHDKLLLKSVGYGYWEIEDSSSGLNAFHNIVP